MVQAQEYFNSLFSKDKNLKKSQLEEFYAPNKNLEGELDLSSCLKLRRVNFFNNKITSLKLPKSELLTELDCSCNNLKTLDDLNFFCPKLKYLYCRNNQISTLEKLSLELEVLGCNDNCLKSLVIWNLSRLRELNCSSNQINILNVSNNHELVRLDCSKNGLKNNLNLTNCRNLNTIYFDYHLYKEEKIIDWKKTSLFRIIVLGIEEEVKKNTNARKIWNTWLNIWRKMLPEMRTGLIDTNDLTQLVKEVDTKVDDNEFLAKLCPKEAEISNSGYEFGKQQTSIPKERINFLRLKGDKYAILVQIANRVFARILILQSRLFGGRYEDYENNIEELSLKCLRGDDMDARDLQYYTIAEREEIIDRLFEEEIGLKEKVNDLEWINSVLKKAKATKAYRNSLVKATNNQQEENESHEIIKGDIIFNILSPLTSQRETLESISDEIQEIQLTFLTNTDETELLTNLDDLAKELERIYKQTSELIKSIERKEKETNALINHIDKISKESKIEKSWLEKQESLYSEVQNDFSPKTQAIEVLFEEIKKELETRTRKNKTKEEGTNNNVSDNPINNISNISTIQSLFYDNWQPIITSLIGLTVGILVFFIVSSWWKNKIGKKKK